MRHVICARINDCKRQRSTYHFGHFQRKSHCKYVSKVRLYHYVKIHLLNYETVWLWMNNKQGCKEVNGGCNWSRAYPCMMLFRFLHSHHGRSPMASSTTLYCWCVRLNRRRLHLGHLVICGQRNIQSMS